MTRQVSAVWAAVLAVGLVAGSPLVARAVVTDTTLCPGTGVTCKIDKKVVIHDPEGIDITQPGPGLAPLTLDVTSTGVLAADPAIPLTIKAGGVIVEKGGVISATVAGGMGNTLNIASSGPVSILGKIDASAVALSGTGGDGGSISITSSDTCQIGGTIVANGKPSALIGGSGGDISLNCASVDVASGATFDASGNGIAGLGGSVSLSSTAGNVVVGRRATVRAQGSGIDGGAVSLSTDAGRASDDCVIGGKIAVDGVTASQIGGSGGSVAISCGGSVFVQEKSGWTLNGDQGGGTASIFCGGNLSLSAGASLKANGGNGSGGSVDIAAGGDVAVAGKIESQSGGPSANVGGISITSGGNLTIQGKSAVLNAGAHKDQQTGQITLAGGVASGTTSPVLNIDSGAVLKLDGYAGGFGALDVDISGSTCVLGGKIKSEAQGNGAAVGFSCDRVTFAAGSSVQVTSKAPPVAGALSAGGTLSIDTSGASGGIPGACELAGKIDLKAKSTTFVDPTTSATVVVAGRGGSLSANCGTGLSIAGTGVIDGSAGGGQSLGGQVTLAAAQPAVIQGAIKAKAAGPLSLGGNVTINAPALSFDALPGAIEVAGETGGTIQTTAAVTAGGTATVTIGKTFNAKGSVGGGTVVVSGCDVNVGPSGWLSADGTGGVNQVQAGKQLAISGKVTAVNGENRLSIAPIPAGIINPVPNFNVSGPLCP